MEDIVFYKNNKYKISNDNYIKKKSKSKFILYNIFSNLYGYSYILISPKEYDKLNKISDIKLSYYFLDGTYNDENDEYLWIKNEYFYDNARELLSKLKDIQITEYCLNEYIWVFSSFYSFIFKNIKINFIFNKKKYKFKNLQDFYKFIFNDPYYNKKNRFNNNLISFTKKKYYIHNREEIIDKNKYNKIYNKIKNRSIIYNLSNDQFVNVDPKFFKNIRSMYITSNLNEFEFDNNEEINLSTINIDYDNFDIMLLYILACSPYIMDNLNQSISDFIVYKINHKILFINGKDSNKNFYKLFNKYFLGIKKSLIEIIN